MTLSLLTRRVRTDPGNILSHPYGPIVHIIIKYNVSFKNDDMSFTLMKIKVSFTETAYSSYTSRLHDHLYIRH